MGIKVQNRSLLLCPQYEGCASPRTGPSSCPGSIAPCPALPCSQFGDAGRVSQFPAAMLLPCSDPSCLRPGPAPSAEGEGLPCAEVPHWGHGTKTGGSASPLPLLKRSPGQEPSASVSRSSPPCLSTGLWDRDQGSQHGSCPAPLPCSGSRCRPPSYQPLADAALTNNGTRTLPGVPASDPTAPWPCTSVAPLLPPKAPPGRWAGGAQLRGAEMGGGQEGCWGVGRGERPLGQSWGRVLTAGSLGGSQHVAKEGTGLPPNSRVMGSGGGWGVS